LGSRLSRSRMQDTLQDRYTVRLSATEVSDDKKYGSYDTSYMDERPFRKDTAIQAPAFQRRQQQAGSYPKPINDLVPCGGYFLATLTFGFKCWIDKGDIMEAVYDALLFTFFLSFLTLSVVEAVAQRKTRPHESSILKSVSSCSRYYRNLFFAKVSTKYNSWGVDEIDYWPGIYSGASSSARTTRLGNCVCGFIYATNHRSIVGRR
jgi:hypothetical protein